jgi:hypothetical protein
MVIIVVVNVGHYLINNVLIILCYIAKSVFGFDRVSIRMSALNKGGSGDPGAQSIIGHTCMRIGSF